MTVSNGSPLTLFLAEDHVVVGDLLCRYLETLPRFRIVGRAEDGPTALAECLRLRPNLAILDVDLPRLDGIRIARQLRDAAPETSVLLFSSRYDAALVRQGLDAGVKGIVEKPAPLTVLVQGLDALREGRTFHGPAIVELMPHAAAGATARPLSDLLTAREQEVLQRVAEGSSNKEVADQLGIRLRTVENHRHNLMRKLNAHNAADLTRAAFRLGLLRPPPRGPQAG